MQTFWKIQLKKNSSVVGFALGGAGPCLVSKTFDFFTFDRSWFYVKCPSRWSKQAGILLREGKHFSKGLKSDLFPLTCARIRARPVQPSRKEPGARASSPNSLSGRKSLPAASSWSANAHAEMRSEAVRRDSILPDRFYRIARVWIKFEPAPRRGEERRRDRNRG